LNPSLKNPRQRETNAKAPEFIVQKENFFPAEKVETAFLPPAGGWKPPPLYAVEDRISRI